MTSTVEPSARSFLERRWASQSPRPRARPQRLLAVRFAYVPCLRSWLLLLAANIDRSASQSGLCTICRRWTARASRASLRSAAEIVSSLT